MEENKKKSVLKKWWFWLIIVILIGIIGGVSSNQENNEKTSAIQTSSNSKIEQHEEVLEVDYTTLYQDYEDNPINADKQYKGKILKLTGEVSTIDREIDQRTYVTFDVGFLKNIRITFKRDQENKVAELSKGQTITIKGKCTGTLLSTTVALDNCELIEE